MTPHEIRLGIAAEKLLRLIEAHLATLPPDERETRLRALDRALTRGAAKIRRRQPKRARHK